MKKIVMAVLVGGLLSVPLAFKVSAASGGKNQAQIARGEYLVKNVAGCPDCHTPMNDKGQFVQEKWLQGTKLFFAPVAPIPNWADTSVNIAGLPGWDHGKAVQLLMTGLAPNGQPARPPMPQYHMNKADAEAVVAYLESLK